MAAVLEVILWVLPDALISLLFAGREQEQATQIVEPPAYADDDLA
jgi:hypothetical protein